MRLTNKEYAFFSNKLGIQFEHWTAKLMKSIGFDNVHTTQAAGDYGVDVIGKLNYHGSFGIQCKHLMDKHRDVGYRAVEEAVAGVKHYRLVCGIVLTNSSFTHHARVGAKKDGILLWDRNTLELLRRLAQSHLTIYDLLDYENMIIPFIKILFAHSE